MARHRSPQGRRAHLGLPLPSLATAAGAGGAALPALAPRVIATVLAGGALAAGGQVALSRALPAAEDGTTVLRLGVQQFLGDPAPSDGAPAAGPAARVAPFGSVAPAAGLLPPAAVDAPVAAVPRPVDVGGLVKAAEMQRRAATAAAQAKAAATAEAARAAEAKAAEAAKATQARAARAKAATAGTTTEAKRASGAVQLVVGRITSSFGQRDGRLHKGLDIAAPIGTPIRAPQAGEVISSGPARGFGLWVRVRHADGSVTTYGHINRTLVRVGQQVAAGDTIAEVGNRGQSTGPHLHIEAATSGGGSLNPSSWLDQRGVSY